MKYFKFIGVMLLSCHIAIYADNGFVELQEHVKGGKRSFKIDLKCDGKLNKNRFGSEKESFTDGELFRGIYEIVSKYGVTKESIIFDQNYFAKIVINHKIKNGIFIESGDDCDKKEILTGIFFDQNKKFNKESNTIPGCENLRLDIEGDADNGMRVNIQFQYGVGTKKGGAFASVNIRKGQYIDAAHLLFCLLQSADVTIFSNAKTAVTINSDVGLWKKLKGVFKEPKHNNLH